MYITLIFSHNGNDSMYNDILVLSEISLWKCFMPWDLTDMLGLVLQSENEISGRLSSSSSYIL